MRCRLPHYNERHDNPSERCVLLRLRVKTTQVTLAQNNCASQAWRVEIIKPTPHVQWFVVRPWCWIVERTLSWLGQQRRLSKDYERKLQTSETLLKLAMIRLILRRLARSPA